MGDDLLFEKPTEEEMLRIAAIDKTKRTIAGALGNYQFLTDPNTNSAYTHLVIEATAIAYVDTHNNQPDQNESPPDLETILSFYKKLPSEEFIADDDFPRTELGMQIFCNSAARIMQSEGFKPITDPASGEFGIPLHGKMRAVLKNCGFVVEENTNQEPTSYHITPPNTWQAT